MFRFLALLLLAVGLAGCHGPVGGGGDSAFEDCYNRPPLDQQLAGCRTGR